MDHYFQYLIKKIKTTNKTLNYIDPSRSYHLEPLATKTPRTATSTSNRHHCKRFNISSWIFNFYLVGSQRSLVIKLSI